MKKLLICLIISLFPLIAISSEKMKCKIYKYGEIGGIKIIARCENSKRICYVSEDGGIECEFK